MSKLVEELVSKMDGGGGLFLGPDETQELLAHIERLNEEVASWQRVHRAEYEKREALDAEIERLEKGLSHARADYQELSAHHNEHCTCREIY